MRIHPECLPLLMIVISTTQAFTTTPRIPFSHQLVSPLRVSAASSSETAANDAAFSAFAETLQDDDIFDDDEQMATWKDSLDEFLDPLTPIAKKQVLLSDLINSNEEIRQSVEQALRERKIDPVLTPTAQKLQDGTRAVARQIASDIIPNLQKNARSGTPPSSLSSELPTIVPKLGSRILDAVSTQAKKQFDQFQKDLADPTRIPERLSKQTSEIVQEARNVFLETPEGLVGPPYTVVRRGEGYEIRDYEGYKAAATVMSQIGEEFTMNDVASSGAAFNALAAYLFGANDEERSMEMTTPVTTTSLGEMRFYLREQSPPAPAADKKKGFNEKMEVDVIDVPAARLAVATFPGFATDGEVARQKDTLLAGLNADGVEIDVPHGQVVPHVVLQYNPPYTIPIVRRNEIAVPVRMGDGAEGRLEEEWEASGATTEDEDLAPSDVE